MEFPFIVLPGRAVDRQGIAPTSNSLVPLVVHTTAWVRSHGYTPPFNMESADNI